MASGVPAKGAPRRPASQALSPENFFSTVVFAEENRRERARQNITARSNSPDFWRQLFDGHDMNRVPNTDYANILPELAPNPNPAPGSMTGPQVPQSPRRPSILESGGYGMTMEASDHPRSPAAPMRATAPAPVAAAARNSAAPQHPQHSGKTPPPSTTEGGSTATEPHAPITRHKSEVSDGPFDLRSPITTAEVVQAAFLPPPFSIVPTTRMLGHAITKAASKGKLDGDADDMLQAFSKRIHGEENHVESMDFRHVDTKGVAPDHFPGFNEKVEELRKKGGGSADISLGKDHSTSGTQSEVLGNMRLKLEGKLTVDEKGWKFDGGLGAERPDIYNFNLKDWGERSYLGEIATRIGASFKGVPYTIKFNGSKPIRKESMW